jgi:hypothetical protein
MARFKSSKPYWIDVKWAQECSRCNKTIARHESAFYYPATRTILCNGEDCGKKESAALEADDFDQDNNRSM